MNECIRCGQAIEAIFNMFVLVDCVFAGFTFRKRALHDMMAGSFCVYNVPDLSVKIINERVISDVPDEASLRGDQ